MANILIDLGHPQDIHIFRYAARAWQDAGHHIHVSALDREMILDVVERLGFDYSVTYKRRIGRKNLLREIPVRTWNTWQIARQHQTDLFVSIASPIVGLVARMMGKPYMAFTDTEPSYNQLASALPFITELYTPDVFYRDVGEKHRRYPGNEELAYLHPDVYTPDQSIFDAVGLSHEEPYFVVRFVAWNATHDVNERGLTRDDKHAIIEQLSQYGKIVISTEDAVPPEFSHLITDYPTDRMPDLLAFAQMYVGEGNTMASEAAVLGTPAVRANTMDMGYCTDLQERGLMLQSVNGDDIITYIRDVMTMPDRDAVFNRRREQFLDEARNVTDVIVEAGLRLLDEHH